jgi:hypothetical protein
MQGLLLAIHAFYRFGRPNINAMTPICRHRKTVVGQRVKVFESRCAAVHDRKLCQSVSAGQ